jgi:hypothetical protein
LFVTLYLNLHHHLTFAKHNVTQFGRKRNGFENSKKVTKKDEYLFSKNNDEICTYFFSRNNELK